MQTYNPVDAYFQDIYVVEKIGTKQGWSNLSPDEDWFTGYPEEMEAFYRTIAYGDPLESDTSLAADAISTIYNAHVSAEQKGLDRDQNLLNSTPPRPLQRRGKAVKFYLSVPRKRGRRSISPAYGGNKGVHKFSLRERNSPPQRRGEGPGCG